MTVQQVQGPGQGLRRGLVPGHDDGQHLVPQIGVGDQVAAGHHPVQQRRLVLRPCGTARAARRDQGAGHRVEEEPGLLEAALPLRGVRRVGIGIGYVVPDAAVDGVDRAAEALADAVDVGAQDGPGEDGQGQRGQVVVDRERRARGHGALPARQHPFGGFGDDAVEGLHGARAEGRRGEPALPGPVLTVAGEQTVAEQRTEHPVVRRLLLGVVGAVVLQDVPGQLGLVEQVDGVAVGVVPGDVPVLAGQPLDEGQRRTPHQFQVHLPRPRRQYAGLCIRTHVEDRPPLRSGSGRIRTPDTQSKRRIRTPGRAIRIHLRN